MKTEYWLIYFILHPSSKCVKNLFWLNPKYQTKNCCVYWIFIHTNIDVCRHRSITCFDFILLIHHIHHIGFSIFVPRFNRTQGENGDVEKSEFDTYYEFPENNLIFWNILMKFTRECLEYMGYSEHFELVKILLEKRWLFQIIGVLWIFSELLNLFEWLTSAIFLCKFESHLLLR